MSIKNKIKSLYQQVATPIRKAYNEYADNRKVNAVLATFPEGERLWVKQVLLNQLAYNRQCANVNSYSVTTNKTPYEMMFDVTVEICRNLVPLRHVVGIQPLTGPVGSVHQLVVKSTEVDGTKFSLQINKEVVEAKSRKLQARMKMSTDEEKQYQNVDMMAELTKALGSEIAFEIANEVFFDMTRLAAQNTTVDLKDIQSMADRASAIGLNINIVANNIAQQAKRGAGNFAIVSPIIASLLQLTKEFVPAKDETGNMNLQKIGILNDSINVFVSPFSPMSDTVIVGYHGGDIDSGLIYSPYVPTMTTGVVVDPATFQPIVAFMTRYGKTYTNSDDTTKVQSGAYYGVIKFDNIIGV